MISKAKHALFLSAILGVVLGSVAPAESQSLRERIRERLEERRAEGPRAARNDAALTGLQPVSITHDGIQRTFYVYRPASFAPGGGAVLVFHGGGGNASRSVEFSNMNRAADQGGFLAVYPEAAGEGLWNDGRASTAENPDDVGFVRAVVSVLQNEFGVDPRRVFAAGFSNGAIFSHRLACDAPDLFAAIAPVAGNIPVAYQSRCRPSQGTPIIMFSGTADRFIPFAGGTPEADDLLRRTRGPIVDDYMSAPDTAQFWASVNGCDGANAADLADASNDGTRVRQVTYVGCDRGDVVLFEIEGGGHTWPGSGSRSNRMTGNTSQDLDATGTMIQFFRRYGL